MGQGDPGGQHQTGMTRTRWHAAPGRGEASEGSGDHSFDFAICAGHLTGCQGVLTPPSIAPSPAAPPQLGAPLGFRTIQVYPKDLPGGRW
jgi:hypothetical protein